MTPFEVQAVAVLVDNLDRVSLADEGVTSPTQVFPRILEGSDPTYSIGAYLTSWSAVDAPALGGRDEPQICRYTFGIQTFLKSAVRAEGERLSAVFVKRTRQMLYRDAVLRSQLSALSEVDDFTVERYLRHGLTATEYSDGSISGGFAFLSQAEFYIESEVT